MVLVVLCGTKKCWENGAAEHFFHAPDFVGRAACGFCANLQLSSHVVNPCLKLCVSRSVEFLETFRIGFSRFSEDKVIIFGHVGSPGAPF